jgi:hypothetical protein
VLDKGQAPPIPESIRERGDLCSLPFPKAFETGEMLICYSLKFHLLSDGNILPLKNLQNLFKCMKKDVLSIFLLISFKKIDA